MMLKRFKSVAMAGLVASTMLAAPVVAQSDVETANRADAQCMAIAAMLVGAPDTGADAMAGGMLMLGYYMGRIEGRSPNFDMSSLLVDVVKTDLATEAKIGTVTDRCMVELDGVSGRLSKGAEAFTN